MSSSSSKSPAFQFYAHDFLAGRVATYSLEEVGAYSLLLAYDWSLNGLPTEAEKLAKLCRVSVRKFAVIWETIGEQFEERDGRYFNPRLALEREKQAAWREKSSKGGKARAAKGGSRVVEPPHVPNASTPSPTPTPVTTTTEHPPARKPRAPAKYPHFPTTDCAALYEHYVATVGAVDFSRFRKALAPLYPASGPLYSTEQLRAAISEAMEDAQLDAEAGNGYALRNFTPETFAARAAHWVEYAAEPLERDGVPTPKAMRILSGGRKVA